MRYDYDEESYATLWTMVILGLGAAVLLIAAYCA